MAEIVVVGGGGHATVVVSVLKKSGYTVLGYTDAKNHGDILGAPYLGDDLALSELVQAHPGCQAILGVGKTDESSSRSQLQSQVRALGFIFPVVVSPAAVVNEHVTVGAGTVVFDGVVVNTGTAMGDCCILNTSCIVEHGCDLGNNVHVSPGAVLSGGVKIGANCMIGAGAIVIQCVNICPDCLVGAGCTVLEDIPSPGVYVGTPARWIG